MTAINNLKYCPSLKNSLFPIYSISTKKNYIPNDDELLFFAHVILRTIKSIKKRFYTDFDAHTTSTCCHGIALSVRELILDAVSLDLDLLEKKFTNLIKHSESFLEEKFFYAPQLIINLARYYICAFVKEKKISRTITNTKKLKSISEVSTNFCNRITHELQKYISNVTAQTYSLYLKYLDPSMLINGLPVSLWGKYVAPEYIRQDKRKVEYASCLFSMQISLAHLIRSRARIGLVCYFTNESNECVDQICYLFQGNGINNFQQISAYDVALSTPNKYEPIVVFVGCSKITKEKIQTHKHALNRWIHSLPSLILACDTHYPQFPPVSDDPEFNAASITPHETSMQLIIDQHKLIEGTSLENPSLFCLTHIYPASLDQILCHISGSSTLPQFDLPSHK